MSEDAQPYNMQVEWLSTAKESLDPANPSMERLTFCPVRHRAQL